MTRIAPRSVPLDPTDLDGLRRVLAAPPDGRRRPIGLRRVEIGADALDSLVAIVDEARRPGDVVVLMDRMPMRRGAENLKAEVVARLGRLDAVVRPVVIGADRTELHADEEALAEADVAIAGAGCAVSVGSGTITDIAKDASHRAGDVPFVVVQTAVSVNAFSDDMAVLLVHGVKRTLPSRWPDTLVVDLDVIRDAPAPLNLAGFGELAGMFTAPADWYLATALGHDDSFDPLVVSLYRNGGERLVASADGVRAGEREAFAELARQMTMTGFAMGVAGRTAPLSGTEHTISHLLDMSAAGDRRRLALHGAQVGVAAVVVAVAWRRVLRDLDPERVLDATAPDDATAEGRVRAAFDRLDATGTAADECWRDYGAKLRRWRDRRERLASFAAAWPEHRAAIEGLVAEPETIAAALRRAGAPTRFSELEPAVPAATARWAVASCHLMRDRLTLPDLVTLGGALDRPWDPTLADELLAEAAAIGGGL